MAEQRTGGGLVWLLAAKAVCCGGLLLVATGGVSVAGVAGWLIDGGLVWLAVVFVAAAMVYFWHKLRVERLRRAQG